jgi:hypothetical protein
VALRLDELTGPAQVSRRLAAWLVARLRTRKAHQKASLNELVNNLAFDEAVIGL